MSEIEKLENEDKTTISNVYYTLSTLVEDAMEYVIEGQFWNMVLACHR